MSAVEGDVADASSLNPQTLGFMCGLEIHQQLATGKLHSRQPSELHDVTIDTVPDEWPRVHRRLRIAKGESGKVDVAAKFEAKRNRSFIYIQSPNSGLIELDDQPPDPHDNEALDVALTISGMLDAHPVPLLQTMRKTVVDGSNTSGFQRTTLVATNGVLDTPTGAVGVDVICLEEDSARKLEAQITANGEIVIWNLDRLGIPLVEIATAPDVQTPDHAKETALALGTLLRDTRRVRRGLGSIRQDLNVSIACGDRVEIKGCQDLGWIPRIIRLEMARQLHFFRLANELREEINLPLLPDNRDNTDDIIEEEVRQAVRKLLDKQITDVGKAFDNCDSKMINSTIAKGGVMYAVRLPHLAGRLGTKMPDNEGAQLPRLGRELAGAAKLAGVAGIFHSDELPAYGITEEEVTKVRELLAISDTPSCGFALCCAPDWQAELALESVIERGRLAWHRIRQEVRNVVVKKGAPEDGTTTAMRPLPGGARMYPETDIANLPLAEEEWHRIRSNLPPTRKERQKALLETALGEDQIMQLLDKEIDELFLAGISGELAPGVPALPVKGWATIILDSTSRDIAELVPCDATTIPTELLAITLAVRDAGDMTREGIVPLASEFLSTGVWPFAGLMTAETTKELISEMTRRAESQGFKPADSSDLLAIVKAVLDDRADFVAERGMGAMGPLMGVVMGAAGGAADGKVISALLRQEIQKRM
ncbi:MAG TPA: Glu-tRNA(Gln) amidotransferase subunit GatE [Candidatus Poseidoniales archaeon]|jgi:glutamyl-tRNA(Gln) amidotransferase subunit E|nr:Glu-tRNA(Gln) amidotransferase subunit GatE [Candidatus Poseidoniales archaeon]